MNLNSIIFPDSLPKLDLHGYDRETGRVMINDYINDCHKQKIEFFTVVHGIGSGILKEMTHQVLRQNKKVLEYKTNYYNNGCTIVHIIK